MDSKAPSSAYYTHTETRLSFESAQSPIVYIQLPSTSAFARTSKATRKILSSLPSSKNEEEYKTRRIASSSGVYHRSGKRFPRGILWRCLENSKVIELRALDLSKSKEVPKEKDANLAIRLAFPVQIARDGVSVADSDEEDTISLFVLTTSNELYTITLRPIVFSRSTASEDDFDRYVKIFKPASLSISSAFRLRAINAQEVLISLTDGRLLRLTRKIGSDGATWDEAAYSDGQWGSSLRGLIRWSAANNTLNYEGASLDHATALNLIKSPDNQHLISASLDHTIKFWNLQTGKVTLTRDLLDIERDPSQSQKVLIHPSTHKALETFQCRSAYDGDSYYVVTFSRHSSGVFKFWGIRDANSNEFGMRDLFEDDTLRAPEPDDGALWTVADFRIQADLQSSDIEIWILMRLNRRYKIYRRRFADLHEVGQEWSEGWSMSLHQPAKEEPTNDAPVKVNEFDPESTTERWINWLTTPGRFTEAALEAALAVFTEGRGMPSQKSNKLSIKERMAIIIGSQVHLSTKDGYEAVDRFQEQIAQEWINFWKIVVEIDQSHWDPLAFVLDRYEKTPYAIFGNGFSILRELSELERVAYNTPIAIKTSRDLPVAQSIEMEDLEASSSPELISAIIGAAARFRNSFSSTLKASTQTALQNELWKDASAAIPERIQAFYDICDFESEISERTYNNIGASLKDFDGLSALRTNVVADILGQLPQEQLSQSIERPPISQATNLGVKVLANAVVDSIVVQQRVLVDLLYLLVFLAFEANPEELPDTFLNVHEIYNRFLDNLKETEIQYWLARQTAVLERQELSALPGAAWSTSTISILERDFVQFVHPRAVMSQSQSAALTQSIRDVQSWVCGENQVPFDDVLSSSSWSTYVKGRLHLIKQEFSEAAHHFKQAAFELTRDQRQGHVEFNERSAHLIRVDEQNLFYSGFSNYYSHIVDLFLTQQAHVQVLNFAQLALQHNDASDRAQRSNLLVRLFSSAVAMMDYPAAYAALVRYTDQALQRKALDELTTKMVSNGYIEELLALPLTSLKKTMENILTRKAATEVGLPIKATPAILYFKILYAFHVRHKNFRAAASVLVSRLEARHERRLKNGKQHRFLNTKQEAEKALDEYLVGINALALLSPNDDDSDAEDEAWVFVEGDAESGRKRRVMRIAGLRERYQSEMDRVGAIELGRWGIVDDDDDDEEDDQMSGVETNVAIMSV